MRVIICILALCLYVLAFNFYLWELTHQDILTYRGSKLCYSYITAGMILFTGLNRYIGINYHFHNQLNQICFLSILTNFALIILTLHGLFIHAHPFVIFYTFNGSVFAVTVIVSICSNRHGFLQS